VSLWQERIYQGFEQLSASGIGGKLLSIENLTYPVEWIGVFIKDFNLSVCIDLGHLIMHGFDIKAVFNKYSEQTSIIHLHGVENGQDHRSLDRLSKKEMDHVMDILTGFMGIVSLEVFSFKDLDPSLNFLEQCWQRYG
jgi:sugar phosphate isomerase/epimerase